MAELQTINESGELTRINLGGTDDGDKILTSDEIEAKIPVTTGFVPYTGATGDVNLGNKVLSSGAVNTSTVMTPIILNADGIEYEHDDEIGVYHNFLGKVKAVIYNKITTISTATYNLVATDQILHVTRTAAGVCTITIPTAQIVSGRTIIVKDTGNAATNNITIVGEGSQTFDGAANLVMATNYMAKNLYSDGTNLFIY